MAADLAVRDRCDSAEDFGMGAVASDRVSDDGDLNVGVFDDEFMGDIFDELDTFLGWVQPGWPVEEDGLWVDFETGFVLEFHQIGFFGFYDVVVDGKSFSQARFVEIGVFELIFGVDIRRNTVGDDQGVIVVKFSFGFLADTGGYDGIVEEVIVYDFMEELFADVAYFRGVFDCGGLGVDAFLTVAEVDIEIIPDSGEVYAVEHVDWYMSGMGVVNGVEDGYPA